MADTPSTEQGAPEALPDNLDMHEAARLMDGIADDGEGAGEQEQPDAGNAQPEGGEVVEPGEGEPDGEEQPEEQPAAEDDGAPPEFWSAEDKAAWASVPPALRPLIQKYEQKRVQFEQEKAREAAEVRKQATEEVQKVAGVVDEAAKWWTANGPQFFKAFGDKWAQVDWAKLAEEDPARCQQLRIQQEQEGKLLQEAHARGQRDIEATKQREQERFNQVRLAEHEKVAAKLPEYFGTREKADKTYKELSEYLLTKGVPANVISNIHEAPIIEMALNSMRFERAQKQASTVVTRDAATGKFTAKTAPTRVQPGPATRQGAGDRNVEQARRVGERFRKTEGADIRDMAELIRLNGL
jgi:hypothetical protein